MSKPPGALIILISLTLVLLPGCGQPVVQADCDQLLAEEKYAEALNSCVDPFIRASAYLGLAGLNMFDLIESDSTSGDIVGLLGLTAENIEEKRGYLNSAVAEVRIPDNGGQSFALLMAALLGLGTSIQYYLDSNMDGVIENAEVEAATGMTKREDSSFDFAAPEGAGTFFHVIDGETPYNLRLVSVPTIPAPCEVEDPDGIRKVYDDPDGSGRLDTSATPALSDNICPILGQLDTIDPVNLVVQMTSLVLPVEIDEEQAVRVDAFLGQGNPETDFPIGVLGYLDLMDYADAMMAAFSGNTEGGGNAIGEWTDMLRARIDNGGECLDSLVEGGDALFNLLYTIYIGAPGTLTTPVPEPPIYTWNNIVPKADLDGAGIASPADAGADGADGAEEVTLPFGAEIGFKLLFPMTEGLTSFDLDQATQRIDFTYEAFRLEFENIPRLAPAAAIAGDGVVNYIELYCASD